jgi:DNA-binding MarR family transcriptional regulator
MTGSNFPPPRPEFRVNDHDLSLPVRDEEDHPLAPYLSFPLSVVQGRLQRLLAEALLPLNRLQPAEWRVLEVLARRGKMCGFSVSALTELDRATVSRAIRRLHDLGLLHAERDPSDGRKVSLSLTAEGREVAEAARRAVTAAETEAFAALTPAERERLAALLRKLLTPPSF